MAVVTLVGVVFVMVCVVIVMLVIVVLHVEPPPLPYTPRGYRARELGPVYTPHMTDDERRAQPIPPPTGDELVIVDGKVVGDLPAAPAGVQWSTFGLDVEPPPASRGLLPLLAIVALSFGSFLLGVLPVDATHWPSAVFATIVSIHLISIAGSLGYRSRVFASIAFALSIVLVVLSPIVLIVVSLINSTPQTTGNLAVVGTAYALGTLVIGVGAVLAFVASFKRRGWPKGLVLSAGVLAAVAGVAMLIAAVVTAAMQGVSREVAVGFHGYWIFAVQLLVLPASAALVGIRSRRTKYLAAALLVLALPPILVPLPLGFTLTHPVAILPFLGAAAAAFFSARRFTETTHYGDPNRTAAS